MRSAPGSFLQSKASHIGRNIVIILIVASAIGAGYFVSVSSSLHSGIQQNQIDITGNSLTESQAISIDSVVSVTCNNCYLTLNISNSTVKITLDLTGNYNTVAINGGQTNIDVTGNYNTVNAQQTTVLSNDNTGTGNSVNT
jgi:hypothetical protein